MFAYLKKVVPHISKGIHSFQIEWEITGTETQGIPVSLCFILNAKDYISLFSELLKFGKLAILEITKIRRKFVQSDLDHQLLGGSFNDLRITLRFEANLSPESSIHMAAWFDVQQKRCFCNRVLDILKPKSLQQNALPWYCWLKKYCTTWDGAKALWIMG